MIELLAQSAIRELESHGRTAIADQMIVHPLGLAMVIAAALLMQVVPRTAVFVPILLIACFVSTAQRVIVLGLDFDFLRIMMVAGWVRVLSRREYRHMQLLTVDKVVAAFVVVRLCAYTVQQGFAPSAFVWQLSQIFDTFGMYMLFRCLIASWSDLLGVVRCFALISIPVMIAFIIERLTARNAFAIFGGVSPITHIREGRLRCQGAFTHPIIAGCFWAALVPLFGAMFWLKGRDKMLGAIGLLCSCVIIVCCNSSTPVMGVIFAGIGWAGYLVRNRMKLIVRLAMLLGVVLHLTMDAPVWSLVTRISISPGNTGYHRYKLMDSAIHRFFEWAAVGTPSTAHWFWGGQDITNNYILQGVRGGVLTLLLFILGIALTFRAAGCLWRQNAANKSTLLMSWALGVSLFVHCINFIGVSYFGQSIIVWNLTLAGIVSLAFVTRSRSRSTSATVLSRQTSGLPAAAHRLHGEPLRGLR